MIEPTVFVHPEANVSADASIGEGTRIWNLTQVREGVRIGKHCSIGRDVYIDKEVVIGDRVKIQNGVSIYRGVTLEDDVFVGPYASFTNDLRPRSYSTDWKVIPTLLRKGCSVGSNATILCGVTLGRYSMMSAGAVVTDDTLPFGLYCGNPARLKGFVGMNGYDLENIQSDPYEMVYLCTSTGKKLTVRFCYE